MLLAKIALGLCGTVALAGAYTFHEGVMRIDADHDNGRHVHVWLPAAVVPMAMHIIPGRHLDHAMARGSEWVPTMHALTRELRKYPEAELVEIEKGAEHVHVRTHQGKLLIDVTKPGETVHISCPLSMMEDVASQLESRTPTV